MTEEPCSQTTGLYRLCVSTDADDAGALPRLLGQLQNLNITPRRVVAEFSIGHVVYVQIDVTALTEERVSLLAARMGQYPSVLTACWHRV